MSTCILTTGAPKRIGFISTRFHGTDGVTLEARKWAHILQGMDHSCFWMAGLLDAPPEVSHTCPWQKLRHTARSRIEGSQLRGSWQAAEAFQWWELTQWLSGASRADWVASSAGRAPQHVGTEDRDLRPRDDHSDDEVRPLQETPRSFPPPVPEPVAVPGHLWPSLNGSDSGDNRRNRI